MKHELYHYNHNTSQGNLICREVCLYSHLKCSSRHIFDYFLVLFLILVLFQRL